MFKPKVVTLCFGVLGLSLAGCGTNTGPGTGSGPGKAASPTPPPAAQRVTLHVEGMSKIRGIT